METRENGGWLAIHMSQEPLVGMVRGTVRDGRLMAKIEGVPVSLQGEELIVGKATSALVPPFENLFAIDPEKDEEDVGIPEEVAHLSQGKVPASEAPRLTTRIKKLGASRAMTTTETGTTTPATTGWGLVVGHGC